MSVPTESFPPASHGGRRVHIVAAYVGERIDPRSFADRFPDRLPGRDPVMTRSGEEGWVAVFRDGVVVFFDVPEGERSRIVADLEPDVVRAFEAVETEEAILLVEPDGDEGVDARGTIVVRAMDAPRVQIVAAVLAKSTALAHYEREVGMRFDRIEPLTRSLHEGAHPGRGHRRLMAQLGGTLLTQARVMGRHEVVEKPDVTWNAPELDRLYARLASEYELGDRARILSGKADFVSTSIQLLIDMDRHRQSIRLEWYIVILILVEIVILVWEMVFRG